MELEEVEREGENPVILNSLAVQNIYEHIKRTENETNTGIGILIEKNGVIIDSIDVSNDLLALDSFALLKFNQYKAVYETITCGGFYIFSKDTINVENYSSLGEALELKEYFAISVENDEIKCFSCSSLNQTKEVSIQHEVVNYEDIINTKTLKGTPSLEDQYSSLVSSIAKISNFENISIESKEVEELNSLVTKYNTETDYITQLVEQITILEESLK